MNVDAADTAASPINVVLNWDAGLGIDGTIPLLLEGFELSGESLVGNQGCAQTNKRTDYLDARRNRDRLLSSEASMTAPLFSERVRQILAVLAATPNV